MKRRRLSNTVKLLSGDFVIVDLGSADSKGFRAELRELTKAVTLVELDAISDSSNDETEYFKKITIRKAIGGKREKRTFYRRKFQQCSSFLCPTPQFISDYDLKYHFETVEEIELDCHTLPALLQDAGIERVDFLKTDLEGSDFEILSTAPEIVGHSLVVQSELRFQPFYINEPSFCEAFELLTSCGFELISMHPEFWKYKTPHRQIQRDGRLVMADMIFFLNIQKVEEIFGLSAPRALAKQIIIAKALGLHNFAEWIYENARSQLSGDVSIELQQFLSRPKREALLLNRTANMVSALPGGQKVLNAIRREFTRLVNASSVSKSFPHLGTLFERSL